MNKIKIAKLKKSLIKKAPTILTVVGAVGMVATVVLAVSETPKALEVIENAKKNQEEPMTKFDMVKATAPIYIPAALTGAATLGCFFGANVLSAKQIESLNGALLSAVTYHQAYREKCIDIAGSEVDEQIRTELARKFPNVHVNNLDIPDQKCIWLDEDTGETIEAYEREIMDAEYHINRNYILHGGVSLNEFREMLGFTQTLDGEDRGWWMEDGYMWIDFYHVEISRDDGGTPIYAIRCDYASDFMVG